ncbi:acyl-coenzyme A diphosphatase NUDT19-like isoform X2 [Phymastichus coffea]|uniref:acyl-coenzyme A diphosphatase NUDT19-like isoform X2 n=1 Tax=Phymastichus coffea TaxID=108790 RepID=UPI00273C2BF3|nr:acyl-coenzyme A diphosphatase NUDT19-like isoform X2 [Phymastichus coffea]
MRTWRESASLIIAARNGLKNTQLFDYNLFLLKRQSKGTFGGTMVFPGGVIEPADADLKWQNLFKHYSYNESNFKSLLPKSAKRPEIFRNVQNELPREVSLRIRAIRETFEECGILLCTNAPDSTTTEKIVDPFKLSKSEIEFWQRRVHSSPKEFYVMCEKLDCYPNIWALYEWANWLTPTIFPVSMRFDTVFFFTTLSYIPDTKIEMNEIHESMWATPDSIMASHLTSLLPPQRYEITRISKYKKLDNLFNYAVEQSRNGIERFVGVRPLQFIALLSAYIQHFLIQLKFIKLW